MNVSDCVVLGNVSVPVTRLTSAAPYVRGARGDGSSFWTSWEKALGGAALGVPPRALAAVKHEESPFKALHPVDALLVNGGTVKSRRKTWDVDNFSVLLLALAAELAVTAENVPRPASARKTPASTMKSPIKTRRLKKADCEADFFFIG